MNDHQQKMWESAYNVMNHPRMGPYMHGAAMMERTSGVAHFWLVRGPATQSVVQELQRQLGQAYHFNRLTQASAAQPQTRTSDRTLAGMLLASIIGLAACAFSRRLA